ncbi:hypothetical protein AGOR_G00084870 [Albula goreensis]|uniref:Uncharacterized protein n=1 Tax=Albula goreensis TaxID=1534307 RepID=A0A8T3DP32_9TELE|nr:hypothetical protein AGOR_G00084870 [Albula goreensis]
MTFIFRRGPESDFGASLWCEKGRGARVGSKNYLSHPRRKKYWKEEQTNDLNGHGFFSRYGLLEWVIFLKSLQGK